MTARSEDLIINRNLTIPANEITFRFSRSGGAGGQHVNRTATRVELLFDVANSPSLDSTQRRLVRERLAGYIDSDGILHLTSQATRSQWRNRQDVLERFERLLRRALRKRRRRVATRPSRAARERRLEQKKRRSQKKRRRKPPRRDEW